MVSAMVVATEAFRCKLPFLVISFLALLLDMTPITFTHYPGERTMRAYYTGGNGDRKPQPSFLLFSVSCCALTVIVYMKILTFCIAYYWIDGDDASHTHTCDFCLVKLLNDDDGGVLLLSICSSLTGATELKVLGSAN